MSETTIVITAHGHERVIDKIVVSLFDKPCYSSSANTNAETYCKIINDLELQNNKWISAKIISENRQYSLDELLALSLDVLLELEDRTIQTILRRVDLHSLARVLKFGVVSEAVKEKIFNNLSKRAAQMLKENTETAWPMPADAIINSQKMILEFICEFI